MNHPLLCLLIEKCWRNDGTRKKCIIKYLIHVEFLHPHKKIQDINIKNYELFMNILCKKYSLTLFLWKVWFSLVFILLWGCSVIEGIFNEIGNLWEWLKLKEEFFFREICFLFSFLNFFQYFALSYKSSLFSLNFLIFHLFPFFLISLFSTQIALLLTFSFYLSYSLRSHSLIVSLCFTIFSFFTHITLLLTFFSLFPFHTLHSPSLILSDSPSSLFGIFSLQIYLP